MVRSPKVLTAFAFEGRVSVRQGEIRHHANIYWRHGSGRDEILLTTPLGQGVAELSRDASGARLVMADRREYAAPDWETLSARVFGSPLPLDGLPAWLSGRPPAVGNGWRIDYLDYQSEAADALPTLIELKRDEMELRLKIDEWSESR